MVTLPYRLHSAPCLSHIALINQAATSVDAMLPPSPSHSSSATCSCLCFF